MKPPRLFQFLIIASLLFSVVGLPAQRTPMANVEPALLELAAQDPGQVVDVIVQKMAGSTDTEERVGALGGRVTHDLHIINAFAAEMPAAAAVKLARSASVRWVGLDAAMESAVCPQCVDTSNLANAYIGAIKADQVWNKSPYRQGQGNWRGCSR